MRPTPLERYIYSFIENDHARLHRFSRIEESRSIKEDADRRKRWKLIIKAEKDTFTKMEPVTEPEEFEPLPYPTSDGSSVLYLKEHGPFWGEYSI